MAKKAAKKKAKKIRVPVAHRREIVNEIVTGLKNKFQRGAINYMGEAYGAQIEFRACSVRDQDGDEMVTPVYNTGKKLSKKHANALGSFQDTYSLVVELIA